MHGPRRGGRNRCPALVFGSLQVFGQTSAHRHTLIKPKSYDSLRDKFMPLEDDALVLHALEFLAIQVRYLGPRWRKKNMRCVTAIAKNVPERGPNS